MMRICELFVFCLLVDMLMTEGSIKLSEDIIKPKKDKRQYRGLTLENGIKTILISDPKADKAAAALSVHIGYLSDPKNVPGMAHFCEHMLFMGTDKYPEEAFYQKFLTSHGGTYNAGTEYDKTTYYFDIAPEYLNQTLDVFSQFFIAPRFNKSAVDRETNAVNSEYFLSLREDERRIQSVYTVIADPGHDFTKFGVGSRESLYDIPKSKGLDPREEVVKFWKKWYSSNIMTLVILGKESLDELQNYAVKYFSIIENKNVTAPSWTNPFIPAAVGKWVNIETLQESNDVAFVFPIYDIKPLYKSKPNAYAGYVLGYSGTGSLTAYLKQKGWIESVGVEMTTIATGFGVAMVTMKLTKEGQNRIEEIGKALFQDINMIRKEGPKKRIFDERQKLRSMEFENKERVEPIDLVSTTADSLNTYTMPEIFEGQYKLYDFDPEGINKLLDSLTPQNLFILRLSDKFNESDISQLEPRYNVSYSIKPIDESLMKAFKDPGTNEYFKLPPKNEYIPDSTDMKPRDKVNGKAPELILSEDLMQVWYYQDKEYNVPKGYLWIMLTSPSANVDPYNSYMNILLERLIDDALTEPLAAAAEADLGYGVSFDRHGITIRVTGYPAKQKALVKNLVKMITSFKVNPTRFNNLNEAVIRDLKNINLKPGYSQAFTYLDLLTLYKNWSPEEMLQMAGSVSPAKLESYLKRLLSQLHIDIFGSGNYERKDILGIANVVKEAFGKEVGTVPLEISAIEGNRRVSLKEGETSVFQKTHPMDLNTALYDYFECGVSTPRNNLIVGLLGQVLDPRMFQELRTIQQLGYVVQGAGLEKDGIAGFTGLISSERSAEFLEGRLEAFLVDIGNAMPNMTDKDFDLEKDAFATKRFVKPKQLEAKSVEFWKEISQRYFNFNKKELEKNVLKKITRKDFVDAFNKCLSPNSNSRRKLNIYIVGTKARSDGYKLESACTDKAKCVKNPIDLVKQHPLVPPPKPFQSLQDIEAKCPRNCRSPVE